MKKQIISMVLAMSMLLSIIPTATVSAEDFSGNGWSFDSATGTLMITLNAGSTSSASWRNSNDLERTDVTSIVIQNGVTSIGDFAFNGCTNLVSVTIPNGVTSIGWFAFSGCASLTSIAIPDSVTDIGEDAFRDCTSLTSIIIPANVTRLNHNSFWGCTSLTEVNVSADNTNYSSVDGVLFNKDKTTIILYPLAKAIGSYSIPEGVTNITGYLFYKRIDLTQVTIPDSVTTIGTSAFDGCTGLTSITIPAGVTQIGEHSFYNCTGLASINVASDNANYSSKDGVLFNKDKSTLIQYPASNLRASYSIPNSVIDIDNGAFGSCKNLSSIIIPDSVTTIGFSAFSGCTGLIEVTIGNSVERIRSDAFWGCTSLTKVTIPNSVTYIETAAFAGCTSLVEVILSNNLTFLGQDLFYGCTSLTTVIIPNTVTGIGLGAFINTGLTSITIPASVTWIGDETFKNCTKITSITFESITPPNVWGQIFEGCSSLTTIYVPVGSKAAYQSASEFSGYNIVEIGSGTADFTLGHIRSGDISIGIGDALEILMYIAKIKTNLLEKEERAMQAALITEKSKLNGFPTISDVLEILMYIAKIESCVLYKMHKK